MPVSEQYLETLEKRGSGRNFNTKAYVLLNMLRANPDGVSNHELKKVTPWYADAFADHQLKGHVITSKPMHDGKYGRMYKLVVDVEADDPRTFAVALKGLHTRNGQPHYVGNEDVAPAAAQPKLDLTAETPAKLEEQARELMERAKELRQRDEKTRQESMRKRYLPQATAKCFVVAPSGEIYQARFKPDLSGHWAMYWLGMVHPTLEAAERWKEQYHDAFKL